MVRPLRAWGRSTARGKSRSSRLRSPSLRPPSSSGWCMAAREPSRLAAAAIDGVSAATLPAPREHGGVGAAELAALGLDPADVLDCSASINPYGPHRAMIAAIRG